ncbi:hypothetical protein CPB83DRAFT_947190 [Crepidotus variabilis]|uniref:Uncharacterized protein n=1 Tax=Crepidotus variabilis TaxID=179855 RepID=A0A9P6JKJ4_9AGAR|nr:hypothetical protein CPB83DRAFT_947190 [Crepidotus variabilis]
MSSPKLPLEILTVVIDALAASCSDDESLSELMQSAALTCRAFVPLSRRHIFASVAIDDFNNPHRKPISPLEFANFFTEHSYLTKYIRELSISILATTSQSESAGEVENLFKTFLNIHGLESLSISSSGIYAVMKLSDSPFSSAIQHLLQVPSLSRLRLSHLTEVPLDVLTTNLKHLSLESVNWKSTGEFSSFDMPPPDLEVLTFNSSHSTRALLSLVRPDNQPVVSLKNLRRLEIMGMGEEILKICRMVASTSKVLASIYLSVCMHDGFTGLYDAISPSLNTLRHLVLVACTEYQDLDPYQHACEELEKIAMAKIQTITFKVNTDCSIEGTNENNWDRIDELLTLGANWPYLTDVRLEVTIWRPKRPDRTFEPKVCFKRLLASKCIHFVYECHNKVFTEKYITQSEGLRAVDVSHYTISSSSSLHANSTTI